MEFAKAAAMSTMRRVGVLFVVLSLAPAVGRTAEEGVGLAPDAVLRILREGNARYAGHHAEHPHADAKRLRETADEGQHPIATVIACSDSRCPVELLFDAGVGDLFVVRVAGNVCDTDETGSVEYGVGHLQTPLLVVLGHSRCGAVTAVVTHEELEGSISKLVDNIGPAVEKVRKTRPDLQNDALVAAAVEANVWQAIEDLLLRSETARDRVRSGRLKIVGGVYHIEDGRVEWLGAHRDQTQLLQSRGE
jgi:carbonic anhydrase